MKSLTKLQLALRRNKRLSDWKSFCDSFVKVTGCSVEEQHLLDVEKSYAFTQRLSEFLQVSRLNSRLRSQNELMRQSTETLVQEILGAFGNQTFILCLANYELLQFYFDPITFSKNWLKILQFDADDIYLVSDDFESGIGIDYYESELTSEWSYEVIWW